MRRALSALCVSGAAAGFVVSGCAPRPVPPPPVTPPPVTVDIPAGAPAVLPAPEVLAEVVYRLADPAIPGADKLPLVEGATTPDATDLDGFAAALRDGGFVPVTVTATDIRWSETAPGDVVATVTIAGPQPDRNREFRFPLEFSPRDGGWQLTQDTAELLLPGPS